MFLIFCVSLFAAPIALLAAPAAAADTYPRRPIRLIAPFPPGGGVDISARILADPLGQALGETVVVDNRAGAGGRLGLELVAKANPDGYTLGLSGIGMAIQRALYKKLPYKGTAPALTALLGNEIAVYHSTYASALPHVKSERLRAFGVTGATRTKTLPAVPTLAESGAPGNEYTTWYGLVAPAGVPRAIIDLLNKATVAALNKPAIRKLCETQGMDPIPSTSAHYVTHLKAETEKWTKAALAAKIDLEQ